MPIIIKVKIMKYLNSFLAGFGVLILASCADTNQNTESVAAEPQAVENLNVIADDFQWQTEQFADLKIVRYQVPGWENLSPQQRQFAHYLNQAGLSGRDIMYDQNYRHNLRLREAFETIYTNYEGDKTTEDWKAFEVYLKRVWFSNGIHHHYSMMKFATNKVMQSHEL